MRDLRPRLGLFFQNLMKENQLIWYQLIQILLKNLTKEIGRQ